MNALDKVRTAIRAFERLGERLEELRIPNQVFDELAKEVGTNPYTCVSIPVDGVSVGRSHSTTKVEVRYA